MDRAELQRDLLADCDRVLGAPGLFVGKGAKDRAVGCRQLFQTDNAAVDEVLSFMPATHAEAEAAAVLPASPAELKADLDAILAASATMATLFGRANVAALLTALKAAVDDTAVVDVVWKILHPGN